MHGLIFVTWERYLAERFGQHLLSAYRASVGETPANAPLASRVYDDATLLAGVGEAHRLTGFPVDTLLREYGRYFILNGLTSHRCAYILTQVQGGRDLLLRMRESHAQMRLTPDSLTPPLFAYEALRGTDDRGMRLIYDSPRKLCPLLVGAIEGAALRYGETVEFTEDTCMRQGAVACTFSLRFSQSRLPALSPQQQARHTRQQVFAHLVLETLPDTNGLTWVQLRKQLEMYIVRGVQLQDDIDLADILRPSILLEAIQHLQHAGLVASTAHEGDTLDRRKYWRVPSSLQANGAVYARISNSAAKE